MFSVDKLATAKKSTDPGRNNFFDLFWNDYGKSNPGLVSISNMFEHVTVRDSVAELVRIGRYEVGASYVNIVYAYR